MMKVVVMHLQNVCQSPVKRKRRRTIIEKKSVANLETRLLVSIWMSAE